MKMTAEQAMERWKQNPDWHMTEEEAREMGREELRRFFELYLSTSEGRNATVDWYMKMYEPYFKES